MHRDVEQAGVDIAAASALTRLQHTAEQADERR